MCTSVYYSYVHYVNEFLKQVAENLNCRTGGGTRHSSDDIEHLQEPIDID